MRTLLEAQHVFAQLGFAQVSHILAEGEFLHAGDVARRIVELFHMPHHNNWRIVLLQGVEHALQKGEIVTIVWVGEPYVFPTSSRQPCVARRRKPAVHLVGNDANAGIIRGKALRHRQATIGRAVVHHNGFPVGEELILQIAQCIGQIRLRVVGRQDYGEEGVPLRHFARLPAFP